MTQYDALNVQLSDSQLNKLKSRIKNDTEVILHLMLLVILMIKIIFHVSCF